MTEVTDILEESGVLQRIRCRFGTSVTSENIAEILSESLDSIPPGWLDTPNPLSDQEKAALRKVGFNVAPGATNDNTPQLRAIAELSAVMLSSLTIAQAAQHLKCNRSRIRQRLKNRTLYGIKSNRRWLLPKFQFDTDGEVRNIGKVIQVLDPNIHPLEVVKWFDNPDPDLTLRNKSLSPAEWLKTGGEADKVRSLAAEL